MKKAYLVLEDGTVFEGYRFGAQANALGELVFTTGVCGYIETLTDPSYCGQIVVQTFPMIGNYGFISEDMDGKCALTGYVVREWCDSPSNFRSEGTIDEFLKRAGIPGICGVDTRHLTAILREKGSMNAYICDSVPDDLSIVKFHKSEEPVKKVTCEEVKKYAADKAKHNIALIDFGTKISLIQALNNKGCNVSVYPANSPLISVLPDLYDGIVLSGGPGEPKPGEYTETIKALFGKKPVLAIGLGHQLLALACGAKIFKMNHGHRGANQPCRYLAGNRTYITEQNHGYAVDKDSVITGVISFVNANDGTCEGIEYKEQRAVSVQFYPDDCNGTEFVYHQFIDMMGGAN